MFKREENESPREGALFENKQIGRLAMKCLAYCSPNWCTAYGTECPVGGVLEKCPLASDDKKPCRMTVKNPKKMKRIIKVLFGN